MTQSIHSAAGDGPLHLLGALALEVAPGAGGTALPQAAAATLAGHVATDLAAFAPDAARLELVVVGAHYDPIELLRPGWPLHRELDQLAARAPHGRGDGGRVIAFGAHDGRLPGALSPSAEHAGGPMRLVPWLLGAPDPGDDTIARIGDRFERELLERGMAGAATALFAQEAFGLRVEHARYLTVHDLLAMTALQYEHAGLGALWPLLETALLSPGTDSALDAAPEPHVAYRAGTARIAARDPGNPHHAARARQYLAVLSAHGIAVADEEHKH